MRDDLDSFDAPLAGELSSPMLTVGDYVQLNDKGQELRKQHLEMAEYYEAEGLQTDVSRWDGSPLKVMEIEYNSHNQEFAVLVINGEEAGIETEYLEKVLLN